MTSVQKRLNVIVDVCHAVIRGTAKYFERGRARGSLGTAISLWSTRSYEEATEHDVSCVALQ